MDFQRLVLFVIFSMSGVFLFQAWNKENNPPKPVATISAPVEQKGVTPAAGTSAGAQAVAGTPGAGAIPAAQSAGAAPAGEIIKVTTDLIEVKINTAGGVIEEVALKAHRDGVDKSKPYLVLMKNAERMHIAQMGFLDGSGLPNHAATVYTKVSSNTDMGSANSLELRLSAPNSSGGKTDLVYTFKRDSYVVDVAYEVTNGGTAAMSPTAYFQLNRDNKESGPSSGVGTTQHNVAAYNDADKYKKIDFKDIDKNKAGLPSTVVDSGWISMVELYFVNAWLPKAGSKREYFATKSPLGETYLAGVKAALGEIAPGATGKIDMPIYMGPQVQDRLKAAAPELDRVVDYGKLSFIAQPMFWLLNWFYSIAHNWGWAIVLLTIAVKAAFYPLNAAAGRSMGKMKLVGPQLKELQTRYAGDRVKLNQEMMALYKKEKINPLGGCLPMVIQIPVFIALYWVLSAAVELRHAPWALWIKDLSASDPYFVLPVLYAITAFAQAKLQPPAAGMDPMQQKMMQYMPVAFAVMFIFFPAGLVLYWTVSNILTIVQQWRINSVLTKEAEANKALLKR